MWRTNFRLDEQIHNRIKILAGFDIGTKPPLLGEPKFVILAYAMYNILEPISK